MSDSAIDACVSAFVRDIQAMVQREAVAAVVAALGASGAPARAVSRRAPAGRPARASAPTGARPARAPGKIDVAVVTYVKAHPGSRVEDMVKALGVPTARLKARVSDLVSHRSIRKTGKTRGTRYFPV
jgi:hypothetical protein